MKQTPITHSAPAPAPILSRPTDTSAGRGIDLVTIPAGESQHQEPLILCAHGGPGAGKSRLLGSAPGDIGAIPMEHKSRQSILKEAAATGKNVVLPDIDLIRSGRAVTLELMPHACVTAEDFPKYKQEDAEKKAEWTMSAKAREIPLDGEMPVCCQRCYYRWHVNRVKSVAYRMADMDSIRTIGIDPFGAFVDDCLYACYGRNEKIMPLDRKTFNREVVDFINRISHKNLVLTHHSDTVWVDNKPTKRTKPKNSFSKIGHFASAMIELIGPSGRTVGEGEARYVLKVLDCQANAELIGTELLFDDDISFQNLATIVYPDAPEGFWT